MSNIIDVIYGVMLILTIALTMVIVLLVLNQLSAESSVQSTFTSEQLQPITYAQNAIGLFDYMLVFIMVMYCIAAFITAYYVRTHPVFFVVMLVLQLVVIAVSALISNVWTQIASDPVFLPVTNTLTFTPLILHNLPIIVLVMSSAIAMISYSTPGNPYEQYRE
ncbi:MAG: hypothetical protein Sv326_0438 [Candidatus Fermentimicrarchaeum limneticum]|uniref:Uncharacterized protein n=1 Tax=Fermentimicrarchaeum limneticum TaxID=2795018 RepID=A0A7D5XEM3_FERL1|nr:MAG: hypothetical protein Sv326_0364 [Candidatus Fermentimicrarchaeum limneticum]QLJ52576.1 MAG: hypothetical protein Sv326_0401 [Candidatus Fermentimicrarchaeum limneticum]QLJ52613.1 MAG: hypothetical protein Sv326_0438 [Candidatus Fermentimicrarchaeum limneticum]